MSSNIAWDSASVQTGISRATPGTPTFFSKKSAFILVTITVSLDTAGYPRRTVSATSYHALPHSHVHRSLADKCHVKRHFFTDFSPIYPTFDRISRVSVASTQMTRQWDSYALCGFYQAVSTVWVDSSIRQELVKTTRKIFETGMKKAASPS